MIDVSAPLIEHPCILNGFIQAASLSAIVIYIFRGFGFCFLDIDKDVFDLLCRDF